MKLALKTISGWFIILVAIASFLRLWNIPQTLMFQGDQGRDALIVSRIFTDRDLVFIGPVTSVGNMYLGPLYYYFMLPFLWLSYPSPVGPAYGVALASIVTLVLMYVLGKRMVGKRAALLGAFLFAFSVSVVSYARFSWNPNIAPLVSLLMVYFTYTAWQKRAWHWALVGLCLGALIQLHYLTLLSLGGAGLIWLIQLLGLVQNKKQSPLLNWRSFAIGTVGGVLLFGLSLTPLVLFDLKHEGLNRKALTTLLFNGNTFGAERTPSISERLPRYIMESHGRSMHIFFDHTLPKNRPLNTALVATILVFSVIYLKRDWRTQRAGFTVLTAYIVAGIAGTSLYQNSLFDHYLTFLFPVSFMILGVFLAAISRSWPGKVMVLLFLAYFLHFNLRNMPLTPPSRTIFDMQNTANQVYEHLQPNEAYSLVLLSESKDLYGQNYRYFLSMARSFRAT